jgi:hypothetical protein
MLRKFAGLALLASLALDLFAMTYLAYLWRLVDTDAFRPQLVSAIGAVVFAFHGLAMILNIAARPARS